MTATVQPPSEFAAAHGSPSLGETTQTVAPGMEREGSGRSNALKQLLTPEAWEQRMERQRQRRAKPDIRAKELAAERERWARDEKRRAQKRIAARAWRKTPAGLENSKRTRARIAADPARDAKKKAYHRAWYQAHRDEVRARVKAAYVPKPRAKRAPGIRTHDPKAYAAEYRTSNRERVRGYAAAFRARNLDKCRAKARRYAARHRALNPGEAAAKSRSERAKLSRSYVARNILGVPTRECPQDLIEMTRAHVQLLRELRTKKP